MTTVTATTTPSDDDPRGRRLRWARRAWRVLVALLCLVLVVVLGYGFLLWRTFDRALVRYDVAEAASEATLFAAPQGLDVLLVGTDDRSRLTDEEVDKYATGRTDTVNTDTLMLLHFPPSDSPGDVPVSLVSIPRDSWVTIAGTDEESKINAAYTEGGGGAAGLRVLTETVSETLGIPINHTLMVDFASFARITEAVGPVEVCLKLPTSDPFTDLELPAGPQVLEPEEALKFVRQRHGLPHGDLDRVVRQQAYVEAAAHAVVSNITDPGYVTELARTLGENLFVDAGFDMTAQGAALRNLVVRSLGVPVQTLTVPVTDINANRDGQSVVLLDEEALPSFVASLDGPAEPVSGADASPTPTTTPSPATSATAEPGTSEDGPDDGSEDTDWENDPNCVY